jgi:spore coat assembly protein
MNNLKVGDLVSRKSYDSDIMFKVVDIKNDVVTLKGVCYRIEADAPLSDLLIQSESRLDDYHSGINKLITKKTEDTILRREYSLKKSYPRRTSKDSSGKFYKPGKVLHIDGDNEYLSKCLDQYKKFEITVIGKYIPEREQPQAPNFLQGSVLRHTGFLFKITRL